MKKYVNYFVALTIISFLGCDDVIEEDITDDIVSTIAPLEDAEIEGNSVQFRWKSIDGADKYRIQVKNEDSNIVILDSLVNKTVFDYAMNPGTYQWRVRGENFAYQTAYTFDSSFSVVSSDDLSNQVVQLNSPLNSIYTNDVNITFTWQGITTAEFYKFQILKVEGTNESVVFEDDNVIDTSMTISATTITEDAKYIWQVSAENSTSFTNYFGRTFFVDTQNPAPPNLLTPSTGQNFSTTQEVNFTWNFNNDTGVVQSPITSTIQIASDENFNNIVHTETTVTPSFSNTFNTAGNYFWRVKGKDDAGNEGEYNSTGTFTIN